MVYAQPPAFFFILCFLFVQVIKKHIAGKVVWWVGLGACGAVVYGNLSGYCCNSGKMAEPRRVKPNFHRAELGGTVYEVPERYHDLVPLGVGAFGSVW